MCVYKELPSQAELKDKFDYSPETGVITLKQCRKKSRIGTACGTKQKNGYLMVSYNGIKYYSHRIIWMWMTGEDPKDITIDHKNRNRSDNKWSNLRLADGSEQEQNKKARGYHENGSNFRAQIRINGVQTTIGTYLTEAEAATAYQLKCKELRREFAPY